MNTNKVAKGIPAPSKIPTSGRDSGTHSRSSSVSNLTSVSDIHSEAGDAVSENAHNFKVNDRIYVNGTKPGYIKYLGKTQFAPGIWAGVILDEPHGKNDGSVGGVKYFSCEPLRGIFIRPQKLSKSYGPISGTGDTSMACSPRGSTTSLSTPSRILPSASLLSSGSKVCSRLRLGERVVVSSTTGVKSGILRFVGETDFAKGEWAGIELDEPNGKNDGSVAGKRYFTCPMKHGLFSPIHKVSRAGGTSTPRSGRATPLMRSASKDSLSSSISNSSKPKARSTGMGIMTTSRALEETLKEKEQHIEQLLKEQDLEKMELARVTGRYKEIEAKCLDLQEKQKTIEAERKHFQDQLSSEKRKLEDLQFQLEEERIGRSEIENNLDHQKQIMKRLENFILTTALDGKLINIKEILEGKENLSEIPEADSPAGPLNEKIGILEKNLKNVLEEKSKCIKELDDLRKQLNENEMKNGNSISELKVTVQEKDDVIANLKGELTTQLEKVTKLLDDNKKLNEQLSLQASEAKGHTDEVIKEFGEKIKLLSDDLSLKNSLLQEYEKSTQEKDSKMSSLEKGTETYIQQIADLVKQNQILQQNLDQKTTAFDEKLALQQSLEDEIAAVKTQTETEIPKYKEKILGLVTEIEHITSSLQEKEDALKNKETEIASFNEKIKELTEIISQMKTKLQDTEENASVANKTNLDKINSLEKEIKSITTDKDNLASELQKELKLKEADYKALSQDLETKKILLTEKESQISQLTGTLNEKDSECLKLQDELPELKKKCEALCQEKERINDTLLTKEKLISDLEKELQGLKNSLVENNNEIEILNTSSSAVQNALTQKEEENINLISKLQTAEQKLEMLNKDSSEHVITLQNELSKLKDENTQVKNSSQQELAKMKELNENMTKSTNEKENALKEKEEMIASLKSQIEEKGNNVLTLSSEVEKMQKEISNLCADKKETCEKHDKFLHASREEFDFELKKKEMQLAEMKEENKKLSDTISEKISIFGEKDEALNLVQNQLKAKESDACKLSDQIEKLNQELIATCKAKDDVQQCLDKQLQDLMSQLKEKEEIIKQFQSDKSEWKKSLETKDEALQQKESLIISLTASGKEKDSQCDDLTQMVEESQAQLRKLNEQIKSNNKQLANSESFINDFKSEKEKQLLDLQEVSKQNNTRYEETIKKHVDDIKDKDYIISKLNAEAEEHSKLIKTLTEELEKVKATNETAVQNTNEIHKDLINKIADLETKYSKLLEDKKKIEDAENKVRGEKKDLEVARDSLLKEKVHQEEVVKDREAKLEALQAEVDRMQAQFVQHKQDLEQKLDVSEMEKQAAMELKSELELQHSVLEELQQQLHNSEEKNKTLEAKLKNMSNLASEKTELTNQLSALEKTCKEKSEKILHMQEKHQELEELLQNNQNNLQAKEVECLSLNEKIVSLQSDKESKDSLKSSLKSLEQENILLKHRIEKMEKTGPEKITTKPGDGNALQMDSEERESLLSQVDFLNSIIVDMKQKNEHLQQEIEVLKMNPLEMDANLNDVKKLAPRLFCDICDMFDLHDTDDCPKQASFLDDEPIPQLRPQGARKLEERPYCNNCEVFGHWTLDCEEQESY